MHVDGTWTCPRCKRENVKTDREMALELSHLHSDVNVTDDLPPPESTCSGCGKRVNLIVPKPISAALVGCPIVTIILGVPVGLATHAFGLGFWPGAIGVLIIGVILGIIFVLLHKQGR